MPKFNFASALVIIAVAATILPPGYPAYVGSYISLITAFVALVIYGWRVGDVFRQPTSLAILLALLLVLATVPFVYQSSEDLMAPVLLLPMLATIALALLEKPARFVPPALAFAVLCLLAVFIALLGGVYERYGLGIYRPGMGNNPIHYATLAAMSGSLAMIGVAASCSPWRYLFLLGPIMGLCCAVIADSRGPMLGAAAMTGVGIMLLLGWFWRDRLFRIAVLVVAALGAGAIAYLVGSGNTRIVGILDGALNIFRFTGSSDDIRAALYASAVEILKTSPVFGVGLGQITLMAQTLFPEQPEVFTLDNLHADWANLGAMAGGMGLFAYLLLLLAPVFLLLDRRVRAERPIVLGVAILVSGQVTLGVSNAMFGILPQTTLYAVAAGYLFVQARRLQTPTDV